MSLRLHGDWLNPCQYDRADALRESCSVGSIVDGKANFMTAAWCGIACMKPPAISVAINHTRHTLKGIQEEKAFSINVPSTELVKEVDFCGLYSGKKKDKSGMFEVFYGDLQTAPLITECPINLEMP